MSPIGLVEPLQRLEEFPSFVSCMKSFGRSIIPPILTQYQRYELQKFREAAVKKEEEIHQKSQLRKSQLQENLDRLDSIIYSTSTCETSKQEIGALRSPSSKNRHENVSIAISKFPTSSIYSSVHTGAIVCANLIENNCIHVTKNENDLPNNVSSEVFECSDSNRDLCCHLCHSENEQNAGSSFGFDVCPEVPCRTYSLMQLSPGFVDDQNSAVDTDCESLPTVICSQKPDTDTESSVTCITQSTDLEKYMNVSLEFSPDNSSVVWDSQSTSQQFTLSRSDDASSGTVVNTENELTPVASTLAEITDNIEDELSIGDEVAKDDNSPKLKRAHSIDSYMKIIQARAKSIGVKKSASEPLDTKFKSHLNFNDNSKVFTSSKTNQLIKEDSKESDEAKDLPEKDISSSENEEKVASPSEDFSVIDKDDLNFFQKKRIRKNSYTLDQPSPVLIEAHSDCSCDFGSDSQSPPHCSALESKDRSSSSSSNLAFTKEKVAVNIPVSIQEKYPVLTSHDTDENLSEKLLSPSVVDVFPKVNENCNKKSDSEIPNAVQNEFELLKVNDIANDVKSDVNLQEQDDTNKQFSSISANENDSNQEFFKHICKELQERYEVRVRELLEEQNRQWLKFKEEFKEQEKLLYENLTQTIQPSPDTVNKFENSTSNQDDLVPEKEIAVKNTSEKNEEKIPTSADSINPTYISIDQNNIKNVSQNTNFQVWNQNFYPCTSSLSYNSHENLKSSSNLLNENQTQSSLYTNSSSSQIIRSSSASFGFSAESANDLCSCTSDSLLNKNDFPSQNAVLLPQCDSQTFSIPSNMNLESPCYCEPSPQKYNYFESLNGYDKQDAFQSSIVTAEKQFASKSRTLSFSNSVNEANNFGNLPVRDESTNIRRAKTADVPPMQSNEASFSRKAKSVSSLDVFHMQNTENRSLQNNSQQSLNTKTNFPVDNLISVCAKSLKHGIVPAFDVSPVYKKIVSDPSVLKRFEKLPAFVKGYLTRRLFKTERVRGLIKTLQDTALLIGKLGDDLSVKGKAISQSDVDFHRQLYVQLMATFHNVYDIFCTISVKEQMAIISESRNLKLKQKAMEQSQDAVVLVMPANAPVSDPSRKQKLSSATVKALERKKRSTINTRTYTLKDFKNFRARSAIESKTYTIEDLNNQMGRPRSQSSSKSHSASAAIYKTSIGISPKRKTASSKTSPKTLSRRCVQLNAWVP